MLKRIYLVTLAVSFFISCGKDKTSLDENLTPIDAIVGVWDATGLTFNTANPSQESLLIQQFLQILTEESCYILTLTFNEDLSVTARNAADYVEVDESSLEVTCPTEFDIEVSSYTFDGAIATVVDSEGNTINIAVRIDGNTMYVNAADLEIPDFADSGELVFTKR